jgi:hypothetical protein
MMIFRNMEACRFDVGTWIIYSYSGPLANSARRLSTFPGQCVWLCTTKRAPNIARLKIDAGFRRPAKMPNQVFPILVNSRNKYVE